MLKDANDKETEAKVNAIFSKWVKQERVPIKQIVTRAELRNLEAVPQAALMLEAAPGYSFDNTLKGAEVRDSGETYIASLLKLKPPQTEGKPFKQLLNSGSAKRFLITDFDQIRLTRIEASPPTDSAVPAWDEAHTR